MEPTVLAALMLSTSQLFGLPQGLLSSLCYVESAHRFHVVNPKDGGSKSLGGCQLKHATARMLGFKGTEKELMRPEVNLHYAAMYLKKQINRYDGDIVKGVAAYNAGRFNAHPSGLPRNNKYVRKVFAAWAERK